MTLPESEECSSDSPPRKKVKLDETSCGEASGSKTGLLSCCDDLMLEIFSYLSPTDLFALSQCCQRIQQLVFDRTLWISVDFRPTRLSHSEIGKYIKFFLPSTNFLATIGPWTPPRISRRTAIVGANGEDVEVEENDRQDTSGQASSSTTGIVPSFNGELLERIGGRNRQDTSDQASSSTSEIVPSFTGELLERIRDAAPNLLTLILENHILDSQELSWEKFPHGLEYLSLRRCHIINLQSNKSFFFGIDRNLPRLKVLDLSECAWFESHSFLALSKCITLEELRLSDNSINDFVPYISLGTRFGFKALTVVDFRRTWVSDREISCLSKIPALKEMYLEAPSVEVGRRLITDMAVTSFGATLDAWSERGYFVLLMEHNEGFMPSPLQVIELCNYTAVTDTSLRHCAQCLKGLRSLNVKGTACTEKGVITFKAARPDVEIISDFDLEVGSSDDNT